MLADLLGLVRFQIRPPSCKGTITVTDDGGVMNKNIGAAITPDKAVPDRVVEPLYFPLDVSLPHRAALLVHGRKWILPTE